MPGPVSKVPPALHALVMQLAGEGLNSEQIREKLWLDHKVDVSARAIRRLIERDRTERADVAKSVVREQLRKHLVPLVRRAARAAETAGRIRIAAQARAEALRTQPDGHPWHPLALKEDALALKALDRELKAANLLLHYAGLNQPDVAGAPAPQADRAALLERVQKIIASVGAAEPKSEPPIH